jgi:hypothetical protein
MSVFDLLVYLIAPEASLVIVAVRTRRDLRSHGARPAAYVLLAIAAALSILAPPVFLWRRDWVAVTMFTPAVLIYFVPSLAVRLTGGPSARWGLALAAKQIRKRWEEIAESGGGTQADADWLMSQSRLLDRWRSPDTAELIDLYQEKISDLLFHDDREEFKRRVAAREARIDKLLDSYWDSDRGR